MFKTFHANFAIPKFALYGERALKLDPEFVHIEDISARSSKNGWLIKPHRHTRLFQILYMFDGELELQLDESNSSHKGSWVISIPSGVVHGFEFHPETKGIVLSLATNLLNLSNNNGTNTSVEDIISKVHILEFQKSSWFHQHMMQYLGLIKHELAHTQQDQQLILDSLVKIVLMTLRRQLHHNQQHFAAHQGELQLTGKFRTLLEEHYRQHWKVSDYAQALHISVSSLNRLCHETLGTTPKALIQERLLIEAKRKLIYTRQTLEQIAYTLGFKDPAYFSRVFKQLEGTSPKCFRQNHR